MLYTLNSHNAICQLSLNKPGRKNLKKSSTTKLMMPIHPRLCQCFAVTLKATMTILAEESLSHQ